MKLLFIGGMFVPDQRDYILANSVGVVQHAADSLQWGLMQGFSSMDGCSVTLINVPFVGSYPRRFRKLWFPAVRGTILKKIKFIGLPFLNLSVIKYFSRYLALARALNGERACPCDVLLVYSAHYPFIRAALAYKRRVSSVKLCLILPDLPEYMSDNSSFLYRFLKKIEGYFFFRSISNFDYFVTLTKEMQVKLNLPLGRSIVVEGIAQSAVEYVAGEEPATFCRYVFYSGTLAERYGIRNLIAAFELLSDSDLELWICGDGDSRGFVESKAASNSKIKYLGQLDRFDVLSLQKKAFMLVNPRTPGGEYTKYSFPSKVMEYFMSGRPVIMYRLAGIPEEYFSHCFCPCDLNVASLAACMNDVANMNYMTLIDVGEGAKKFVINEKSAEAQVSKIFNLFKGEEYEE